MIYENTVANIFKKKLANHCLVYKLPHELKIAQINSHIAEI